MKSEEVNGVNAFQVKRTENLKENAEVILKTMVLLAKNYGVNYLARILRGDWNVEWKDDNHPKLETFGMLSRISMTQVKNRIYSLIDFGLISPVYPNCFVLEVTQEGKSFLEKPKDLMVSRRKLYLSKYAYMLAHRLRQLTHSVAKADAVPVFRVLNEHAIQEIIRVFPQSLESLQKIDALSDVQIEKYGAALIGQVKEISELQKAESQERMLAKAKSHSLQQVKALYEQGFSLAQISEARKLKVNTVRRYLITLHQAGEIDLKPWIEEHLDSKALYKGAEFFKNTENPRLRDAYETLGLSYEELRLCKLYVSDYRQLTTDDKVAA